MKFYLSFSLGFILFYCTFMRVTIFQYLSVIKLHLKKRFHKKSSMNVKVQNKNGTSHYTRQPITIRTGQHNIIQSTKIYFTPNAVFLCLCRKACNHNIIEAI